MIFLQKKYDQESSEWLVLELFEQISSVDVKGSFEETENLFLQIVLEIKISN